MGKSRNRWVLGFKLQHILRSMTTSQDISLCPRRGTKFLLSHCICSSQQWLLVMLTVGCPGACQNHNARGPGILECTLADKWDYCTHDVCAHYKVYGQTMHGRGLLIETWGIGAKRWFIRHKSLCIGLIPGPHQSEENWLPEELPSNFYTNTQWLHIPTVTHINTKS